MLDPIRQLLSEANTAKETKGFWLTAARVLSEWSGGTRVELAYQGIAESGTVAAGPKLASSDPVHVVVRDAEGRVVDVSIEGAPAAFPIAELKAVVDVALQLAGMVGRRASLERERRLGTFLVELSRWLLAAPDRELLLRYTLQSLMSLVDA